MFAGVTVPADFAFTIVRDVPVVVVNVPDIVWSGEVGGPKKTCTANPEKARFGKRLPLAFPAVPLAGVDRYVAPVAAAVPPAMVVGLD
jgi:hypothetical protein